VADLGPGPPLFWVKKEEITERRKAGKAIKTKPGFPLAQGLDLPLQCYLSSLKSGEESHRK